MEGVAYVATAYGLVPDEVLRWSESRFSLWWDAAEAVERKRAAAYAVANHIAFVKPDSLMEFTGEREPVGPRDVKEEAQRAIARAEEIKKMFE